MHQNLVQQPCQVVFFVIIIIIIFIIIGIIILKLSQGSPIKTNTGEQISQENLNLNQDLEKTRNGTVTRRPPLPR